MLGRSLSTVRYAMVLAGAVTARAQQPWSFQQVSTADGLTDNAIERLYQDRAGALWIGTGNGLNKYDGHHVWTWRRSDGLGGDQVAALLEDRAGTLWIATKDGGLTRMDKDGSLRTFRHADTDPASIAVDRLNDLFELDDTTLVIAAEQVPIIFLDKRTFAFRYWSGDGPITPAAAVPRARISADWCHSITALNDERIVACFLLIHQQSMIDRHKGITLGQAFGALPQEETITRVVRAGDRLCGIGWQRWLAVRSLNGPVDSTHVIGLPDEGTSLIALDDHRVLIGTKASGLQLLDLNDGSTQAFRHRRMDRRTIADDRIRCLLRDSTGRIWVGTRNGLSVFDPSAANVTAIPLYPEQATEQPDITAYRMDRTPEGGTVVSTSDGVFLLRGADRIEHRPTVLNGRVLHATGVFPTTAGTFLGTEEGLFRYDLASGAIAPMTQDWKGPGQGAALTDLFQVRSLHADTLGGHASLVAGVAGYGLTWMDLEKGQVLFQVNLPGEPRSLGNNLTRTILRTHDGTYWTATAGGLFRWMLDKERPQDVFEAYRTDTPDHALPGNDVQALLEDPQRRLFVATRDGGLCALINGQVKRFPCPRPLGNTVFGLARDAAGRIWCTTADGLEVLDPIDGSFLHVPVMGAVGPAAWSGCIGTLSDGRIAAVAENTLFLIDPDRALRAAPVAAPYLTGLSVLGEDVLPRVHGGGVDLASDQRSLSLALSALRLTGPGPLAFTVRLEGVDPAPRATDREGRITYSSLPPGSFRLFARTIDGNGRLSAETLLLTVEVAAPFWQRWWSYALLVVIVGGVSFAFARYRYQQALKLQEVRNRIASDLHDEVGSSLSSITIGSQLAAQLSTQGDRQVQDLLERIGTTSSESLQSMSDIVWAIDPKNDEGEALVKRMRRIAGELLESKGVQVELTVGAGVEDLKLPMNARKDLLLIYKEAVHNASKHAGARHVHITLERTDGALSLSVKDDGKGFDPALHADGHGLASMMRRGTALGSVVRVESAPGKGTCVSVRVDPTSIRY